VGTYRTLRLDAPCPSCGRTIACDIQFKYGVCQCDDVRIGAAIEWARDLRFCYGRPVGGRVQIDGAVDPCPHCAQDLEALLTVDDDRLVSAELVTDLPDLGPEGVLELGGQREVAVLDADTVRNGYVECPHCRWKSDTCTDAGHPAHVFCERCGGGISRSSWGRLRPA